MREETATWLSPMMEALRDRGDITPDDLQAMMRRACMPAAESLSQSAAWVASYAPPGGRTMAIDWIRYGQLMREELGWDWYPEEPS